MGKMKMELGLFVSLVIILLSLELELELGVCAVATNSSTLRCMCIQRERAALLSFKATLSKYDIGPLPSWNSSNRDCCSWEGVTCHKITGHVITLDLIRAKIPYKAPLLAERVDSSLGELKQLTYLDLSCIEFYNCKFPAYLGSLKQLQYLNLSGTSFSGVVPQNLGNLSSLRTLDLSTSGGDLEVDDLRWANRLLSLEHLDMSDVNLSMAKQHVFEVLTTLPSLLFLSLSNSDLDSTQLPDCSMNNFTFLANVQHLDLSFNYFYGEFPCFLSNMTSLTFLDLSFNKFNPSSSTHLPGMKKLTHLNLAEIALDDKLDWTSEMLRDKFNLKSLDLNGNGINGDITGLFKNFSCHKIERLSLGDNNFYGELHQELGELSYLKDLDLSQNHFNGPIPTSFGKLSALTSLDISSNNFSGPIPSLLANLTSLRSLYLSRNKLSGDIPVSLGELSQLEIIDISFNSLDTTLSEAHFTKLSKLVYLDLSFNKMIRFEVGYDWVPPFQLTHLTLRSTMMADQFPQWLQTQMALYQLELANCSIRGSLPAWLRSMNSLSQLDLSHNNISGPIPELSSNMHVIELSDNMLTRLPSNIGHMMPFLVYLNLAENLINGSMPDSLCRMERLSLLDLSENHFSGNLPNCWPSGLQIARLSNNEFTGVIPNFFGGASSLLRLHLNDNALTGQLPSSLKNCTVLQFLNVGGNNFSGKLPQWIGRDGLKSLQFLVLRDNDFSSTIPRELCGLSYLQVMDLANNNLTGNIPPCFANFSDMMIDRRRGITTMVYYGIHISPPGSLRQVIKGVDLEYTTNFEYVVNLDLSSNHLVGEIPWVLTNLSGLLGLNLSHNHLGGQIPAKIGDMKSLESLDLSNNNLQGMIPNSLSNLNFLSRLNLSNNNLSGQIPAGRQLQTLEDPASIYQGNPLLCGPPLQRKCDEPGITPGVEDHAAKDEDRVDGIWFYGIIIASFATGFWAVIGSMVVKTKWRQAYFRYIEVAMAKMLGY